MHACISMLSHDDRRLSYIQARPCCVVIVLLMKRSASAA